MKDQYTTEITIEGKTYKYINVPKVAGENDYGERSILFLNLWNLPTYSL